MESQYSQEDIKTIEKSLLTITGIKDVKIIEQKNPNADNRPRTVTVNFPGIGQKTVTLPPLNNNNFFVRITFDTPQNLAMVQKDLSKHPFFDKISQSKKDPLVIGARMTRECAEKLYDITAGNEIDMALIYKYGGEDTMKRFLYQLLLRENVVTITVAS